MTIFGKRIGDLSEDDFDQYTVGGILWRGVAAIVAIGVVVLLLGLGLGWFDAATKVISPTNVKAQFQHAYTDYESLKATAGNVCTARAAAEKEPNPDVRSQRETQAITYENNYRRIQADYDAAYDDAFRAKHVGPRDLPRPAPGLDAMLGEIGCG
jgi:hypothetical protein